MIKRVCDECKEEIVDGYISVNVSGFSKVTFETMHVCEKCIDVLPYVIKQKTKV